jgi:hypothetical protein
MLDPYMAPEFNIYESIGLLDPEETGLSTNYRYALPGNLKPLNVP